MGGAKKITLAKALDIYCEYLGLPDRLAGPVKAFAKSNADDLIWLSDQPLTVHREGQELVVDSDDLDELLKKVSPIKWPDEGRPPQRAP
jgi:hypothetical protein